MSSPQASPDNQLTDVMALTGLLREAEEHHGGYEATARKHPWSPAVRR